MWALDSNGSDDKGRCHILISRNLGVSGLFGLRARLEKPAAIRAALSERANWRGGGDPELNLTAT